MLDVSDLGTVLGVWAHPDDEAYLAAGVMAAAVDAGQRAVCVTATRGGAGGDEEVRAGELAASLAVVGVQEHHWLPYADGTCADVPEAEAAGLLARLLQDVDPDTVLTFGPDGMTGHPDHRAVSRWTDLAFAAAAHSGARVLHVTRTAEYLTDIVPLFAPYDVYGPGTPPLSPESDLVIDLRLAGAALERKVAALRAQESQTAGLIAALGAEAYAAAVDRESYVLAAGRPA